MTKRGRSILDIYACLKFLLKIFVLCFVDIGLLLVSKDIGIISIYIIGKYYWYQEHILLFCFVGIKSFCFVGIKSFLFDWYQELLLKFLLVSRTILLEHVYFKIWYQEHVYFIGIKYHIYAYLCWAFTAYLYVYYHVWALIGDS